MEIRVQEWEKKENGQSLKLRNKVFTLKFRQNIPLVITINKRKHT
jgi:hypothetical protein